MLVNTSQQIGYWGKFFPEVDPHNALGTQYLGLLVNMFSIGSIVSFFVTYAILEVSVAYILTAYSPYVADHYGRKTAIVTGCLFMVLGGCLTAFANGYNSEYQRPSAI